MSRDCFYVTTPIYYANAQPHLGTLYSTILADVAARIAKVRGKDVFFLTGTDEHGQKIAEAAYKGSISPQQLVDANAETFKALWQRYNIDYSSFIRTTDSSHIKGVQRWIEALIKKGDIYKGTYTGLYCVPCESFVLEKEQVARDDNACPSCGRQTTLVSEECYFFKLSAYQDKLLALYANNPSLITPSERLNEVISFVRGGLKDLAISRTTVTWGIPFPGDEEHKVYVWADALNNYITAIGYGDDQQAEKLHAWWPADLQVMGKDIVRFHAVYWPAFLMASDLEMPEKMLVHGWIKVGEHKMSKSLGNAVDPLVLADTYGVDSIRYYLIRHLAINHDSPFNMNELVTRINADLANDLGNLLNRMLTLSLKNDLATIKPPAQLGAAELELRDKLWTMIGEFNLEMEEYYYNRAYGHVWKFIHELNTYFHNQEPWKVFKDNPERFNEIMSAVCHGLNAVGILVWPVMPAKMKELFTAIGVDYSFGEGNTTDYIERLSIDPWNHTFTLVSIEPLFKRIEIEKAAEEPEKTTVSTEPEVSFEDFLKVKMAVGTIKVCEEVPKSDRLYRLEVDFGDHTRQILSGIKAYFTPADLIGKQAVFVINLKPRKIMGLESQGMILTAQKDDGTITLIGPGDEVPSGMALR